MRALRLAAVAVAALVLWAVAAASGATTFPALSGRVVDAANILSEATKSALTTKLASLDDKSGIQLVVATVPSLQGEEIEPFANELFRFWKIGEAKKDNGVLLLVAPKEHKVRIEVGYGLEGTLTDAISKLIIVNAIAPRFKAGDFDGGVTRGVDDVITTLTTDSSEWQKKPALRNSDEEPGWVGVVFLIVFIVIFIWVVRNGRGGGGGPGGFIAGSVLGSGFGSGRGGGGGGFSGGGGGFSGGGGSSGGGGASGSW